MLALAESMTPSVSAQAISKYEANKMMPSSGVLVSLSKTLGVSLDFLMGGQVEELRSLEWRKTAKASAQDRAKAEAVVIGKLEDYLAIENILSLQHSDDPFVSVRIDHVESNAALDKKAREVRRAWELGSDPIPSMTALLEDKGLKVIEADLPERINGMACHVERANRPSVEVIVVARQTNVERKRFNLAHELAHRIIVGTGNPSIRLESAMNRFAGAFLIPSEHLIALAGEHQRGVTYHEIMRLKQTYGVSAAAMLMRLRQVGILSEAAVEYAFKTYARSWRTIEPEPMKEDEGFAFFEVPQRFDRLVWRALGEELISPVRAAQMLRRPLNIVEREMRGPRDQ